LNTVDSDNERLPADVLKSLNPAQIGAAFSKLRAASVGDMVVVLSRSPAHKHYSLADIEWMVMPPVSMGQFYIVEAMDQKHGFRAPIAAVTWAFVSDEVDQALQKQAESLRRLRPDQWNCGTIGWLLDAAGDVEGVRKALQWLAAGPFKDRPLKMTVGGAGAAKVTTLDALLAERAEAGSAP
jgi:cytolysin-activating lysine-acyltransferase